MPSDATIRVKNMFVDAQPNPEQLSLEDLRINDDALFNSFLPDEMIVEEVDAGGVPALWVSAPGAAHDRTTVFFHGGGYIIGSAAGRRAVGVAISRAADCRVLLPKYRLAPEHPFPAAIDDAVAVYRWLTESRKPSSIVLSGDSAGGGLAVAALLSARERGLPLPAGAALLSPLTDLASEAESWSSNRELDPIVRREMVEKCTEMYLNGGDRTNPLASPGRADLSGLPPLLVLIGSAEALLDDANDLATRAGRAGCQVELRIWPEMFHIWPLFASILPEGQEAIEVIGEFVRRRTSV